MQAGTFFRTQVQSFARSGGHRSLRQQLLLIAGVLLVAAIILMGTSLSHLQRSLLESEAAEHTILEITTIETRLVDYDGNVATSVYTGDKWFGERLASNRREMDIAIHKLQRSLQKTPAELQEFRSIDPYFRQRDALIAQVLAVKPGGESAALAMVRSIAATDDVIRGKLWNVLLAERAKRISSHANMIAEARKSFWLAVGIVSFTFLIGVCFFWLGSVERPASR